MGRMIFQTAGGRLVYDDGTPVPCAPAAVCPDCKGAGTIALLAKTVPCKCRAAPPMRAGPLPFVCTFRWSSSPVGMVLRVETDAGIQLLIDIDPKKLRDDALPDALRGVANALEGSYARRRSP